MAAAPPRYSVLRAEHGGVAAVLLADAAAGLTVGVAPALGAELCSLRFRGVELVHRALDFAQPAGCAWYGHGQLLFPAVGRQRDGRYAFPAVSPSVELSLEWILGGMPKR